MTEGTRSSLDRRSGIDRRRAYRLGLFMKYADEKRSGDERRSRDERRKGWVRGDRWSSLQLEGLKIAKFLKLLPCSPKTGPPDMLESCEKGKEGSDERHAVQ